MFNGFGIGRPAALGYITGRETNHSLCSGEISELYRLRDARSTKLEPWSYQTVCFNKSCMVGPGVKRYAAL